jgi:hypothetical protein
MMPAMGAGITPPFRQKILRALPAEYLIDRIDNEQMYSRI